MTPPDTNDRSAAAWVRWCAIVVEVTKGVDMSKVDAAIEASKTNESRLWHGFVNSERFDMALWNKLAAGDERPLENLTAEDWLVLLNNYMEGER